MIEMEAKTASLDEQILESLGYSQQVEQFFGLSSADLFDAIRFYSDLYRLDLALTFAKQAVKSFQEQDASPELVAYVAQLKSFIAIADPVWRVLEEQCSHQHCSVA